MNKIAIYCRTANQSDEAIESQKTLCLDSIKKRNPNIDLSRIVYYIDNGFPAHKDFAPNMKKLLEDLKNDEIQEVYTVNISRLSRNIIRMFDIRILFEDIQKDIFLVQENMYIYKDYFSKITIPQLAKVLNQDKENSRDCNEIERE